MWAVVYLATAIAGAIAALGALHWQRHAVVNPLQLALAGFLVVNAVICLWELVLFFCIDHIRSSYEGRRKKLERGDIGKVFLFEHATLGQVLTPSFWAQVWITYSLVDESYSDSGSFGWNIDVGNGFSSLVPTVLFAVGMSLQGDLMPARVMGLMGALAFYQMLYGTVVYFLQYCVNRRWRNHGNSWAQIVVLVLLTNVTWIVFPAVGLWASARMVMADSEQEAFAQFTA